MRTHLLPIALATSMLLTACGGGGDSSSKDNRSRDAISGFLNQSMNCEVNGFVPVGQYVGRAVPGAARKQSQPYTDCIAVAATPTGVKYHAVWNVPQTQGIEVTATVMVFGAQPGGTGSNGILPKQAVQVNQLQVNWDIASFQTTGAGALSIDASLTDRGVATSFLTRDGNMAELMINLQTWGGWTIAGRTNPVVSIDGRDWYMQVGNFGNGIPEGTYSNLYGASKPDGSAVLQYRAFFQPVQPLLNQGTVDVKKFYQYLVDHNLIPNSLYFGHVEVVTETHGGTGDLQVNNLTVDAR